MVLFLKLLLLLWSINFAPPLAALVFDHKWAIPFDGQYLLPDGRPLFGSHKTVRGVLAGVAAGLASALVLGFPWWLGLVTGALSMAGDLFSSFIKRRLSFISGDVVPGLDQAPEGLLPFLLLAPYFELSPAYVLACGLIFGIGAFAGSIFLNEVVMEKPFESYPRKIRAKTRIREILSCQIIKKPFHYMANFEDAFYYHFFMKSAFQVLGVYERGVKNALEIEVQEVAFDFPDLPQAFDGYRILFLVDLHLDGLEGLVEKLQNILREIPADLCVLGGDYRMETYGPFDEALHQLRMLLPEIRTADGVYAILGNHDCVEIVETLREDGINFLINDARPIERNGGRIWLVGVDDPHYFKCHNLEDAFSDVPRGEFSIFFAHSNEIYRQALEYSPKLYICGHSHGGQILIPAFGPIFTHSSAPRHMFAGHWTYNGMRGYTSGGVGVSGVPVRLNTKGEVTVITLRKGTESA